MLSHCAFIASDKWRSGSLCWVLYVFYPPFYGIYIPFTPPSYFPFLKPIVVENRGSMSHASAIFSFFFFFCAVLFRVLCGIYILRAVKYKDLFWSTDNVYTPNWDTPYCQFCVYLTLYGIRNFQSLSYFTSHLIGRLYVFYIFSSCIALRLCKSKVNPDIAEQFSHNGEVGSYCNTAKLDLPKFRQKRI